MASPFSWIENAVTTNDVAMKKYYKHCLFIDNKVLNFINLNSFWGFESSFEMKELRGYGILAFTITSFLIYRV